MYSLNSERRERRGGRRGRPFAPPGSQDRSGAAPAWLEPSGLPSAAAAAIGWTRGS